MTIDWSGIFPAITTKFNPDYSLDLGLMERHADWLIREGVSGLITGGSLGEASTLHFDEKVKILEAIKSAAAGRVPVIGTVAENATLDAMALAAAYERAGADGLMVLPGLRYQLDDDEISFHFRAVAGASALPIMVYNNPLSYGTDIRPDLFARLQDEPKFEAIKESSGDLRRISEIIRRTGDRYRLFSGVDDLALESLLMGAHGWVAGLVTAFPRETVAIYDYVRAGRLHEARSLYRWFLPLLRLDVSVKLVQNIKLVETMVTPSSQVVRPPRQILTGPERDAVLEIVKDALATRPLLPGQR